MKIIKIISLLILLVFTPNLYSQTYNMPASGYLEIHSNSGSIFDNGGSIANYSSRVNSILTVYPATSDKYIRIYGDYFLEDYYKSKITFYDGDTNSNIHLQTIYNNGNICVKSNTGAITMRFTADTETPKQGFSFNFYVGDDIPKNISYYNITDSTAEIKWDEINVNTNWVFILNNNLIINLDTNYIKLDSLDACKSYSYMIYSACDSQVQACANGDSYYFNTTSQNSNKPFDFNLFKDCKGIEMDWQGKDTNTVWQVISNYSNDTLILDSNYVEFDSLDSGTFYEFMVCPLVVNNENCDCERIYTHTDCCCPIAQNIIVSNIGSRSATISWDSDNDTNAWILQYVINDIQYGINNDSIITIYADTNYIEFNNLTPVRPYRVYIYPICDTMNTFCRSEVDFFTSLSAEACVEFTNLKSSNFFPKYGTYSNSNIYNGLIDYNYLNPHSRHTIHYDTSQRDARTNYLLSTIPQGELASFRLGNWLPGGESESCTYAYYVDTNNFDMFLLKYAIVLEDPNHNQAQQPRFTLEIMDSNYNLFDQECGYTDFYASGDLNWNSISGSNVIWKDWTSIGIDLSKYHNRKIYIRFTTYDCEEGGHFGYAYINLKCDNKYTNKDFCGDTDTLLFEAPLGFDYLWYDINKPNDTISTQRHLSVVANNNKYFCKCSYKENNNCSFILTFLAEKRFPFPQFDFSYDTCGYKVYFFNKSIISSNDSIAIGDEECMDIKWIFHDGTISYEQNPEFIYDSSGVYKVILIAMLNDRKCVDTLFYDLFVDLSGIKRVEFYGDKIICRGSQVEIYVNEFDNYLWNTNDSTKSIIISPLETTQYYVQVNDHGCIRNDSIIINVTPYFFMDTIFGVVCRGIYYNNYGFFENEEGFYTKVYKANNGCDSIRNLILKVADRIENYSVIDEKSMIIDDLPIIINAGCNYCFDYYWNTGFNDSLLYIDSYGSYYVIINHVCGIIYDSINIKSPDVNIFIPNAFTPDESKNNSFFPVLDQNSKITLKSFEVYNRWGDLLYNSTSIPWNGKIKNSVSQNGVYVWRLLYTTKYTGNRIFEKIGEVNLIR